jgi:hypothetical protein
MNLNKSLIVDSIITRIFLDHLKKDSTIVEEEYVINLPSKTRYVILQDSKEETKAKLRIQASRTRY